MKNFLIILVLVIGGGLAYRAYQAKQMTTGVRVSTPLPPTAPPKKQWTPDDIAKDPQGYLVWSGQQVQAQIAEREKRLNILSASREDIVARQKAMTDKIDEVNNFRTRLQTAYQKAEDEDRWPVRMAGRTFERAKAQDMLNQFQTWLDDRQPLATAYDSSLKKIDDSAAVMQDDLRNLAALQDKLSLDLERVKLNQGMAELDTLRKTETQLASMSAALSKMSEDQAPVLPTATKSSRVDIDSLLK